MPRKGKKQLAEEFENLGDKLQDHLKVLQQADGISRLGVEGRKLVLALLIAAIVPADGFIRDEEIERLRFYLQTRFAIEPDAALHLPSLVRQKISQDQLMDIAHCLGDMLTVEDRCKILLALWDLAMCDKELHQLEENFIYRIADAAAVPRKLVIEQQRKAAAASAIPLRRA